MMKIGLAVIGLAFGVGINPSALAQLPGISQPGYATQRTGIGTTSKTASGAKPSGQDEEKTSEEDDTLYRGKTSELESTMLRDEGMLHFKTRPKEKVQQVDSKNLFSTGTDPKFQGNLALSGVSSIDQIAASSNQSSESDEAAETEERDARRFKPRERIFKPQTEEKAVKAESDSTPSPTPSPSVSPAAKKADDAKE